jgi:O-antigen/teichoic acid export membrane protein
LNLSVTGLSSISYLGRIPGLSRTLYLRIRHSKFGRHVLILTGGTVIARGLVVLASPLLTRLYLPADFGVLSVFFSIVTATVTASSLNYEAAIPLPKDDEFGLNVMGVSFAVLFLCTLLCTGLVTFMAGPLAQLLRTPQLERYLWLLPLSLLGGGTFQILNSWSLRVQAFRSLAMRRIIQSVAQVITQLGMPLLMGGPFGLLLGDCVGRAGGSLELAFSAKRYAEEHKLRVSAKKLAEAAIRYKRFPVFGTASVLMHASFWVLPALLLTRFFGLQEAGWYGLVNQILVVGAGLLGLGIAQVYFSNAAQLAHTSPTQLRSLFLRTSRASFLLGVVPFGLLIFTGPFLFGLVFGANWIEAGRYAQVLAVPFLIVLTVGPVFPTLTILERQDWQFVVDLLGTLVLVCGMFYVHHLGLSGRWAVAAYGVSLLLNYLCLFGLALVAIQRHCRQAAPTG